MSGIYISSMVLQKEMIDKNFGSALMAWFDLNDTYHAAKQYLYNEIKKFLIIMFLIKIHRRFIRPQSLVN